MSGTINLVGPSTSPGAPQITPAAVNTAVNTALATKQDFNAPGVFTTLSASGAATFASVSASGAVTAGSVSASGAVTAGSVSAGSIGLGGTGNANVWSGNTIYAGNGRTVTVAPGAQTTGTYSLFASNNVTGTSDRAFNVNRITVPSDSLQSPGDTGGVNWLSISGNTSAGFTGKRAAVNVEMNIPASSGTVPNDDSRQWVAEQLTCQVSANQGGVGFSGNSAGFLYAGGDQMWAYSGATFLSGVIGREIDVAIYNGASAGQRTGLQIITFGDNQGVKNDSGLRFGCGISGADATKRAPGFQNVIQLHTGAVSSTGAILQYTPLVGGTPALPDSGSAAGYGIDVNGWTFATAAWRSAGGVLIDGQGVVNAGALKISTASSAISVDASGSQVSAAAVSAGGSNYVVGDQLYDPNTGTHVVVSTVSGSTITGVTLTIPGAVTGSTPSNPVSFVGGTGGNATLNLTWAASTTLKLNPSGGLLTVGGLAQLKSYTVATLPAAAAGNAGCIAYVTDATAPTYRGALTGGGAVKTLVFSDGAAWTSH